MLCFVKTAFTRRSLLSGRICHQYILISGSSVICKFLCTRYRRLYLTKNTKQELRSHSLFLSFLVSVTPKSSQVTPCTRFTCISQIRIPTCYLSTDDTDVETTKGVIPKPAQLAGFKMSPADFEKVCLVWCAEREPVNRYWCCIRTTSGML